ncbi:exodeoxyribonuclease III [Reichenbachiella sp. MALMAid0571]|uniref:exodeoxyribonuclease III n=1 Tax=Reichenbachiella sp. MALMAid0571 TaxID=3143939 RepID=UPI0032DEBFA3
MQHHLISWNLNGIRAAIKKGFLESLKELNPDILCIQETKAQDDQVLEALDELNGYHIYSNSAEKKGYSGTAILSKTEPLSVTNDVGISEHDFEGRVIAAEYDRFFLVTVYVPNSKRDLSRLEYRSQWDADFLKYLKSLEKIKPVIVCGDFNVAHREIDIARPKANYNKSAGFTQIEIDGMDNYTNAGLIDTFRHLHPEEIAYSWWSYMGSARERNIGWRIDYFLTSEGINSNLKEATIHPEYMESDHCPVGLKIEI